MRYITQGSRRISQIGLGTARFGTLVSEAVAFELLDYYVRYGGNFLDTARNYYSWNNIGRGVSEETIGKWMMARGNRADVCICTKGGMSGEGTMSKIDLSLHNLMEEIKQSKEALQTNCIDIYLLHKDEPDRKVEEIMDSIQYIKEEARIEIIGVSNWRLDRIVRANKYAEQHGYSKIEAVSTCWSIAEPTEAFWNDPTTTSMNRETYDYLLNRGILTVAYSSQAKGFFQKAIIDGFDNIEPFLKQRVESEGNIHRLDLIRNYCERNDVSPTAVVNGYITQNRLKGVALVSCSSIEHLKEIIENSDIEIDKGFIQQFDAC